MERFTPQFQGKPWADGMEIIHAYVLPRPGVDDELLALAHVCWPALLGFPIDPAFPATAGDPAVHSSWLVGSFLQHSLHTGRPSSSRLLTLRCLPQREQFSARAPPARSASKSAGRPAWRAGDRAPRSGHSPAVSPQWRRRRRGR